MKICEIYNHREGKKIIKSKPQIWSELEKTFSNPVLKFQKRESRHIKTEIANTLNKLGWADSITITPTNLTFNFIKRKVGLCFQLGNVARTYADLLKIQLLFERKVINVGVIAVPIQSDSKKMGSNHAQYERLFKEIELFSNIIYAPIILIGLTS